MRTDRELLEECLQQLKHIDETNKNEPLATTESLIREINLALNIGDVTNRTCVTCLYCQTNPSSEFKHDRHKCTLVKPFVNITNATTHVCNDWNEIPF